jgi:hypothetical protein
MITYKMVCKRLPTPEEICDDFDRKKPFLTVGKTYVIYQAEGWSAKCRDDCGSEFIHTTYMVKYFCPLSEYREYKLNQILNG